MPSRREQRRGDLTAGQFAELVFWQIVLALVIGWGALAILWGVLILLGRTAGAAAMWAMLIEGVLVLAVGLFSTGIAAYDGPAWGARWFAARWGTADPRSLEGRGLTLTAQCLLVAVPMLLLAGIFGK